MRVAIAMYLAVAIPLAAQPATKTAKGVKAPATTPKDGIQTPGIRIPFASLKAEAELPMAPIWMGVGDAPIVPAPKRAC